MKIDAHQHFWRYNDREYGWISDRMAALRRDFLPEDLAREQGPLGFDGSVAVQARQSLAETEWLLELADEHPRLRGVVGWVDLCSPEVGAQLDRFAGRPKLRGVRHVVQDEPDDRFLLREDFLRGVGLLGRRGLTYDILIYPRHLAAARELAGRFREQAFVLDHIAKPSIREGKIEPWATDIRALAAHPNVCCKLSGMVTEADWERWKPADFQPYLDVVVEAFGPRRLMVGSDWPVCTVAASYAEVMGMVTDYIGRLSQEDQSLVLGGNAASFYGIG
jgi:L-fuconolactonase